MRLNDDTQVHHAQRICLEKGRLKDAADGGAPIGIAIHLGKRYSAGSAERSRGNCDRAPLRNRLELRGPRPPRAEATKPPLRTLPETSPPPSTECGGHLVEAGESVKAAKLMALCDPIAHVQPNHYIPCRLLGNAING